MVEVVLQVTNVRYRQRWDVQPGSDGGMSTVNKKEGQTRRCSSGGGGGGVERDYEEQTVAEGWNGKTSGRYTERVLRLL
jgi:hypothetical protein